MSGRPILRGASAPAVGGGAAAAVGGGLWLVLFGGELAGIAVPASGSALWAFPLLFGAGTVGIYSLPGARPALAAWARPVAIGIAGLSTLALLGAGLAPSDSPMAYAGWLGFVGGIFALLVLVLVFGLGHRGRAEVREIAAFATAVAVAPVVFLLAVLGYKLATGWWVTDPTLIAIGQAAAAVLIGGGWLLLGLGTVRQALISSRS